MIMTKNGIRFIQNNLYHSKGTSAVLSRRMVKVQIGVFVIQEPWVVAGVSGV